MPLARVRGRTDSITRLQLQREAWPISAHAHWHSTQDNVVFAPRVLHFSAFHWVCLSLCVCVCVCVSIC